MLQTERLVLRRFCQEDLQDLHEYLSDEEVVKFEPYHAMDINAVRENLIWRISTDEMVAVELPSQHKLIGNVYVGKRDFQSLELGYVFNKNYWGKGYAYESCLAIIKEAFAHGVHRIFAECDPQNQNSWKLLEKLCFQKEAHHKKNVYFWKDQQGNPILKDTVVYALLNENNAN